MDRFDSFPWVEEGISELSDEVVDGLKAIAQVRKIAVLVLLRICRLRAMTAATTTRRWSYKAIKLSVSAYHARQAIPARLFKAIAAQMNIYLSTRCSCHMSSMAATGYYCERNENCRATWADWSEHFALDINGLTGNVVRLPSKRPNSETIRDQLSSARNQSVPS